MNITQIRQAIPILMNHNIVPYLHGMPGVGKTQVTKQIGEMLDMEVRCLYLATQEVGDLVGLLVEKGDGTVTHARPNWFPSDGKGIIFLDEFNRAPPEVLQTMLPFVQIGMIHNHKLPPGWKIIAAGNYQTNQFTVTDMSDAALISRFCHIDFQPTKEEFIMFMEDKGAFGVANFIRQHPEMLETKPKEGFNANIVVPDRRSWNEMIFPLDAESSVEDFRFELYSGIVGPTAASAYLTFKAKEFERISGRDILNQYDNKKVREKVITSSSAEEVRFDLINSAVEEIFLIIKKDDLNPKQIKNFQRFLLDIPLEMGLKIFDELQKINKAWKNEILNNPDFVKRYAGQKFKRVK